MYLKVFTTQNVLVCSGSIVNRKYDLSKRQYLYSIDNKYFFAEKSRHLILQFTPQTTNTVPFEPSKFSDLVVLPWTERDRSADIYVEKTIYELDEEIKPLVESIIKAGFQTTGSCSGHNNGPSWVTVTFTDLSTAAKFCSYIRTNFTTNQIGLEIPPEFSHESCLAINLVIPMADSHIDLNMIKRMTVFFDLLV